MASLLLKRPVKLRSLSAMALLPAIEHPNARLGNVDELRLTGVRSVHSRISNGSFTYLTGFPPEYTKVPAQFKNTEEMTRGLTVDDLDIMIRDRLTTSYHGIRQHFKGNDPMGQGRISRDALLRILRIVCGNFSTETFNAFMYRHGLEQQTTFEFGPFMSLFQDNELVQQEWLIPNKHARLHFKKWGGGEIPEEPVFTIATQALPRMREKVHKFGLRHLLPKSCFYLNGMIVAPQLRESMAQLGIRMTDIEFLKFWLRCDMKRVGALKTDVLFKILGLDPNAQPQSEFTENRPVADPIRVRGYISPREVTAPPETGGSRVGSGRKSKEGETVKYDKKGKVKELLKNHKLAIPPIDSIINTLLFKFESAYNLLHSAFKLFDFLDDGFVAKVDFRFVCSEFGFPINSMELDKFVSRNGLNCVLEQIQYKDFMVKFHGKSIGSLSHSILTNKQMFASEEQLDSCDAESMAPRIVKYLHAEFMKFLNEVWDGDKDNNGCISKQDLQTAIENALPNANLSAIQWSKLWVDVGLDENGIVAYHKLFEKFNIKPGAWNTRIDGGHEIAQVTSADMDTSPLDGIREVAKVAMKVKKHPRKLSPLEEDTERVKKHLTANFRLFDNMYRETDRKATNRLSCWQFGALLRKSGLDIPNSSASKLWLTLDLADDGMATYGQVVRHFCPKFAICGPTTAEYQSDALENPKEQESPRSDSGNHSVSESLKDSPLETSDKRPDKMSQVDIDKVFERLKPIVLHNWLVLKEIFKKFDTYGYMTITKPQLQQIFKIDVWELNKLEKEAIFRKYRNPCDGRFNYVKFLESHLEASNIRQHPQFGNPQKTCYDRLMCQIETKQPQLKVKGKLLEPPNTVASLTVFLRDQIVRHYKNMWRGFKKIDINRNGYLEAWEFRRVLTENGIRLSDNDFYHIMAQYDSNMDGRISYKEFLNECCNI